MEKSSHRHDVFTRLRSSYMNKLFAAMVLPLPNRLYQLSTSMKTMQAAEDTFFTSSFNDDTTKTHFFRQWSHRGLFSMMSSMSSSRNRRRLTRLV